jgi:histidine ammonia-lyase
MTVVLRSRSDIDLDIVHRVARQDENVRLSETALRRIAACRASFLRLIEEEPDVVVYGVTTAMGELASQRLAASAQGLHAKLKPLAAATSFGDPLPNRIVRAIVLARLANFLEGHAATSARIAEAVAAMLDHASLPPVPGSGQGGAGEILALYPLFSELSLGFDLDIKERGSLINGSPCATAMLADSAISARRRLACVEWVFALSIEAFRAPHEHFDEALEALWGDEHEAAALCRLRQLLSTSDQGRRNYQAPISYRIVPRGTRPRPSRRRKRRARSDRIAPVRVGQSRLSAT